MRNKILESEVFKLDDSKKSIGIFKLMPGQGIKKLAKRDSSYTPIKNLSKMIDELAYELGNWHNETHTDNNLLSKINEVILKGALLDIGTPHTSLGKQFPAMIRKIDKETKKTSNIKIPRSIKSAIRTRILMDLFKRYTTFNDKDIQIYISYLLHSCEIEEGTPLQIRDRLRQNYYRTLRKID